ncbi:hypothetical protein ACFSUJ_35450 [Streptomyces lusitanus]|uniref:hypothetical protein n=1 Tax=Streptomyces lusitanus TaxID=68232 RepID=UPI0036353BE1
MLARKHLQVEVGARVPAHDVGEGGAQQQRAGAAAGPAGGRAQVVEQDPAVGLRDEVGEADGLPARSATSSSGVLAGSP